MVPDTNELQCLSTRLIQASRTCICTQCSMSVSADLVDAAGVVDAYIRLREAYIDDVGQNLPESLELPYLLKPRTYTNCIVPKFRKRRNSIL